MALLCAPDLPALPLLCLHASASGGQQWKAYPALLPTRRRVLAPDLIGYGPGSTWSVDDGLSLDDEAERLAPLLERGDGLHLFGHSYGGAVALQLALRWPHRVKSLTLYEPVRFALLRGDDDSGAWPAIRAFGNGIGALVRASQGPAAAERFVDFWAEAGAWARIAPLRQQAIVERMPKVGAEFAALFADTVLPSAYGRLPMPVRLLTGSRSPLPGRRVAERLAQLIPAATLVRLPGLGHMGPLEDAGRVAAQLAVPLATPVAGDALDWAA